MGRYRTINTELNRQYRNDLNANFAQIEQDILAQENITAQTKLDLLTELRRIERESKERDNALAGENLEALLLSIQEAKNNANTAASNAELKAQYAEEQGVYAKTQGEYAKAQGEAAYLKAEYANEKALLADEAAGNANLEASNLSQLKVSVVEATQDANNAAMGANKAADRADEKATYAQAQGEYAKEQAERAKDVVDGTGLLTQTDIGIKVAGFNENGQVLDKNGNVVEGKVKSVNNIEPDENGNIEVPTFGGNYDDLTNKPKIPSTAAQIPIVDQSNLFTSLNVEDALSELFTNVSNGKNQIATAITGKGVSASGGDTFSQLASAISNISSGKKTAEGTASKSNGSVTVNGLGFTPSYVVLWSRGNELVFAIASNSENVYGYDYGRILINGSSGTTSGSTWRFANRKLAVVNISGNTSGLNYSHTGSNSSAAFVTFGQGSFMINIETVVNRTTSATSFSYVAIE